MKIDDGKEVRSHNRTIINFDNIGLPNIIRVGKVNNNHSTNPLTEHLHLDSFEFVFFFSGEQMYYTQSNQKPIKVKAGEFFISMPNEIHSSRQEKEEKSTFVYLIFHLTPDEKNFLGLNAQANDFIIETFYNINKRVYSFDDEIKNFFNDIISEYFGSSPMKYDYIKSLFVQIFYSLTRSITNDIPKKHCENKLMETVIELMKQNPQSFYSTEQLSNLIYMSNSHFKSTFKKYTGFTPYDYMVRNKVSMAEDMLKYTHMTVTEISYELGFGSSQHFSSIFKKYTFLTPTEFRKKYFNK